VHIALFTVERDSDMKAKLTEVPIGLTEKYIERHYAADPLTREKIADPVLDSMHQAVRSA
jgi:hypothetical protein